GGRHAKGADLPEGAAGGAVVSLFLTAESAEEAEENPETLRVPPRSLRLLFLLGGDQTMIDRQKFADWHMELATEFTQYIVDHPEADDLLPEKSHICFDVAEERDFSQHSLELAKLGQQCEGGSIVVVRLKGLAPRESRLIDPKIEALSVEAS